MNLEERPIRGIKQWNERVELCREDETRYCLQAVPCARGAEGSLWQRPNVLGSGRNVSDAPSAFPEGGFAEGGLRDAGRHLPLCGAGFCSPKGGCSRRWGRFLLVGLHAEV